MTLKGRKNASRRFTNAQIAGIAVGSVLLIGALSFLGYQTLNPTSFVRQQIVGLDNGHGRNIILSDAQLAKLSGQLVDESADFFATDVMADFIERAVDATLDEDTIKSAVYDVVVTSGMDLSDTQKDAIAKQVRQNVEASWLAIMADNEGFSDDQLAFLTTLISERIAAELGNYTITTSDDYELASDDVTQSFVTEVL